MYYWTIQVSLMCRACCMGRKYWSTPKQSIKQNVASNSTHTCDWPPLVYRLQPVFAQLFPNSSIWWNNRSTCRRLSSQPSIKTSGTFWPWHFHPSCATEELRDPGKNVLFFVGFNFLIYKILTHFPGDLRERLVLKKWWWKAGCLLEILLFSITVDL